VEAALLEIEVICFGPHGAPAAGGITRDTYLGGGDRSRSIMRGRAIGSLSIRLTLCFRRISGAAFMAAGRETANEDLALRRKSERYAGPGMPAPVFAGSGAEAPRRLKTCPTDPRREVIGAGPKPIRNGRAAARGSGLAAHELTVQFGRILAILPWTESWSEIPSRHRG